MIRRVFYTVSAVLALSLMVLSCNLNSDGAGNDPIKVDQSLPAVTEVPNFEGTFVTSQAAAETLISDSMEEIVSFMSNMTDYGAFSSLSYQDDPATLRSAARAVTSESVLEIYDHDTTIFPGTELTGFVEGTVKSSYANENDLTAGDYLELSLKAKFAIDFDNIDRHGYHFNGKYAVDEDIYEKMLFTKVDPITVMQMTMKIDLSSGYAMSVSKGGKGLKFVTSATIKGETVLATDGSESSGGFDTYKLTIDVYDNDNTKQYSITVDGYNSKYGTLWF
jgi:hypothetical protein